MMCRCDETGSATSTHLRVALLAVLLLTAACDVAYRDRILLLNNTDYLLVVGVRGEENEGWLLLGTAEKGKVSVFRDVIDQGDLWIFRFSYGGEHGGAIRISRMELERRNWRVEVPAEVGERLRAKGLAPSFA